MKNYAKKGISLLLAVAMSMSVFGCSLIRNKEEDTKAIKKLVKAYMDGVKKDDSEEALSNVDGKKDPYEKAKKDFTDDQVAAYATYVSNVEYSLSDIEIDARHKEASALITVEVPNIESKYSSIDDFSSAIKASETSKEEIDIEFILDDDEFYMTEKSSNAIAKCILGEFTDANLVFSLSPIEVTEAFINEIIDADYDGAYEYCDPSFTFYGTDEDQTYCHYYTYYLQDVDYEYYLKGTYDDGAIVVVSGFFPDVYGAIDNLYMGPDAYIILAFFIEAELHPDTPSVEFNSYMFQKIQEECVNLPSVYGSHEVQLKTNGAGDYKVYLPGTLLPDMNFPMNSIQDVEMYNDAIMYLYNQGRISTEEYTKYYEELNGTNSGDQEFTELEVAKDVTNEGKNLVGVSYSAYYGETINKYSDVNLTDFQYFTYNNSFEEYIDSVMVTGDYAPDFLIVDCDYVKKYANADYAMPINFLGISYSELSNMYKYPLYAGSDDSNIIYALSWELCPSAVFYNREIAKQALGVSEPDDVAPYFASWDSVVSTANRISNSTDAKFINSWQELTKCYTASRTTAWNEGAGVNLSVDEKSYFDLANMFENFDYVTGYGEWSSDWMEGGRGQEAFTYWGPMWLSSSVGISSPENFTGEWGVVPSPEPWFYGGTYIMATKYCDRKADVANLMRDLTIDVNNMHLMFNSNDVFFVNNMNIMREAAALDDYKMECFGGQNPYGVFDDCASNINGKVISPYDSKMNELFTDAASIYIDSESYNEALNYFVNNAIDYIQNN